VSEVESKLVESDAKLEKMMSLKSVKHLYDKIKHEELNSIKKEVDNYDRNVLPKLRAELKQNEESLKKIEKLKSCGDVAQNEIVIIDKYANECNDLDKKIQLNVSSYQKCGDGDLNDDLENLELERCSIKAEIEQLNELIKSKQNEINQNYERTDRINKLKESLNELKSKKNEIEFKFQKKNQLVEKKMELEKERELNQKEINELNKQLAQSTLNLNRLSKERQEKLENNTEISGHRTKYLNDVKQVKSKMDDILVEVISHEKNADVNTFNLKKEMKSVDNEEREINSEIEACRQKLDNVKNEIARHDLKQRELMDNLCLREKRKEYEAKKQHYFKKQEELPIKDLKLTLDNFKSEQKKCDAKREELLRELNEVRTNMHNLDGRIQTFKEELNLDNYKNALEKYLICASELRVLEVSVQDTEKYYKALDKAIMNYHSMKMSEINKTIKQLWRQVYRGNDIDFIEIRSEEDSAGNEEVVKARRTYNYRVVLIKGETAMDMRGRCSAGQKVLASIIIRLALAESFGLNSGILALDEPTTNLDRENIESLASALVE
jgi:DNA repair protein RAD50